MGIQDRDYYKEHHADLKRGTKRRRRQKRIPVDLIDNANPPWWRRRLSHMSWLEQFIWAALAIIMVASVIRLILQAR